MRIVEPKIFVLAHTKLGVGMWDYLADQNAPDTYEEAYGFGGVSGAETLIEVAGRACYRSFAPGLNPNVTKVREGNKAYIANILKQLHGSVLEHASITFAFVNVSRVFTHELVRHRSGTAVSQESMRYVRLDDIPFAQSDELASQPSALQSAVGMAESAIAALNHHWGLNQLPMREKKIKTSAMRRLAPIGTATSIIWTCNLRELRHVITLRTAPSAEEEIRKVFRQVAKIALDLYPNVFQDFTEQPDGSFEPKHWKV